MSHTLAQLKEDRFDFVHDTQRVFRILMNAMANPASIGTIPGLPLRLEKPEYRGIIQPFLTLLDLETTFHAHALDDETGETVSQYISINTGARSAGIEEADFILCLEPSLGGGFPKLKRGSLSSPHRSATVFYLADRILPAPENGDFELLLKGPGIDREKSVFVSGIEQGELVDWRKHRSDYPLGIDIYLVGRRGEITAIPRSAAINE